MRGIDAFFSAARLLARTTGLSISAAVTALSLKAEVVVGFFLRQFFATDEASVTDTQTLDVTKPLTESPSVVDADVITLLKSVSDSGALTDDDVLTIIKGLTETPAVTEAHIIAFTKPLTDSGAITDAHSLTSVKPLTEAPSLTDNDTLDFTKIAGSDTAYDYCDITYFAEDYVEGPREDRASVAENNVISITKFLSDQAFATDDLDGEASAEDDQEISFVKTRTEIASLTDLFSRIVSFARSFTESPSATDDLSLTVSKSISEAPAVTDELNKVIAFTKSDAGTVSDSEALNTSKNLSDNGGIIDAQVVQFTKASSDSGVAADSGSLRSQGYCDFTYFAEDYVGASRTF